ncbi:MAG: MBL fold metallo-hydrolase [Dehalococcoidales bacterium]|nr:MBL fold metallo-hydrolase [Dehalococcoidales bacterium]
MKITVVYDNEVKKEGLRAGWGFSAFIESEKGPPILFDTGADSPTLVHNMKELNIDPKNIEAIVISHAHGDHTGGLSEILRVNEMAELFLPASFGMTFPGRRVTMVRDAMQIGKDVFSTGTLEGIEQSLALQTEKGIFVLTGCAHPAMRNILGAASKFGKLCGIAGGFHGFQDFRLFEGLSAIYPCHCTQYKREILDLFPGKALQCGAGLVIEL